MKNLQLRELKRKPIKNYPGQALGGKDGLPKNLICEVFYLDRKPGPTCRFFDMGTERNVLK